jgi:hypothetical protein
LSLGRRPVPREAASKFGDRPADAGCQQIGRPHEVDELRVVRPAAPIGEGLGFEPKDRLGRCTGTHQCHEK